VVVQAGSVHLQAIGDFGSGEVALAEDMEDAQPQLVTKRGCRFHKPSRWRRGIDVE
jgi:hypothetical protein